MYLYLFTSTAWKFICTVCSTEYSFSKNQLLSIACRVQRFSINLLQQFILAVCLRQGSYGLNKTSHEAITLYFLIE